MQSQILALRPFFHFDKNESVIYALVCIFWTMIGSLTSKRSTYMANKEQKTKKNEKKKPLKTAKEKKAEKMEKKKSKS